MEWASLVAIDSLVFVASLVITRLDHLLPISVRIGLDFDPGRAEKRPFNAIQCHSMPFNAIESERPWNGAKKWQPRVEIQWKRRKERELDECLPPIGCCLWVEPMRRARVDGGMGPTRKGARSLAALGRPGLGFSTNHRRLPPLHLAADWMPPSTAN